MRSIRPFQTSISGVLLTLALGACQEIPTNALKLISIHIEAPETSLQVGETLHVEVSASTPRGGRLELVGLNWSSSDPAVADVVDGRISGRLPGQAYIHAYVAGIADSVLVTVEAVGTDRSIWPAGRGGVVRAPGGCWEGRPSPLGPSSMC